MSGALALYICTRLLRVHCLASCDCHHLVDVVYRAAAAKVVDRTGDTLEDWSDSVCVTESLNELVADVTNLEAWEHENISVTCNL